ncbi:hypothetical protein GOBAR_AA22626 [Gossypium barbadense]|uniref:Axial regulator YABBY 2 n=1 Tax=Gossypium barbadense TaxID=3634 RepID=A0A2P5X435_GOSBA|nr:hypothetical protein GOBAR_AA22626 [Gossypium barbadense]
MGTWDVPSFYIMKLQSFGGILGLDMADLKAVSVPCNSAFNIVTVRCGHCANLLSVNMGTSLQTVPSQDAQAHRKESRYWKKSFEVNSYNYLPKQQITIDEDHSNKECGSSSKCNKFSAVDSTEQEATRMPPIRPPEKRQRVPSAYNRFIKEEIQRIKASNPDISHREAFSTAAKNRYLLRLLAW